MKAGWTKLVLAVWLSGWLSAMYFKEGFEAALWFFVLLGVTALLAYQAGKGDDAWM